jgi:hypothetical protein
MHPWFLSVSPAKLRQPATTISPYVGGHMIRHITAMLLFGLSTLCHAQQLWQDTKVGMTTDEVKALYPNATGPRQWKNPTISYMDLGGVDLLSKQFQVTFRFRGGKLDMVTLKELQETDLDVAMIHYAQLQTALRGKYGAELTSKQDRSPHSMFARTEGLVGQTSIALACIWLGSPTAPSISYSAHLSKDLGKI